MTFVSVSFWIFFPVVTVLYFLMPHRFRWLFLLVASCIFYMAFVPAYILILFALIIIDYLVALGIERSVGIHRKHLLLVSVFSLVGILLVFKYFNFVNANIALLAQSLHWSYGIGMLAIALPLGLSFHAFQSLSYVIEVYRGKQKAERNFGIYALYVMFYPQLVAGPIERPQHLLHQFYEEHTFDYERVKMGLIRMVWGFFKKMVVADKLGVVANHVFTDPYSFDGIPLIIAAVFFTFELYFDFSAYCDIALGAAQVMGFTLMENFNRPFASTSVAEFWRRWHISLSSWFRDYLYYPLVLNRKTITPPFLYAAIFATFLITGFWHGADWTFGVMGALFGFYILFGSITAKYRKRFADVSGLSRAPVLRHTLQVFIVFVLVVFAFIFFRSANISVAMYIVTHMWVIMPQLSSTAAFQAALVSSGLSVTSLGFSALLVGFVLWCEYLGRDKGILNVLAEQPVYVRWAVYWAIGFMILLLYVSTGSQFIYFRF